MKKILFFVLSFFVGLSANAFAESITLTTYYPAPFGMYQEMRVMGQLGVGTTDPQAKVHIVAENVAQGALAAGIGNTASSLSSSFGLNNVANGQASFATGNTNTSSGDSSFSSGAGNTVSGLRAFASGFSNTVSATTSFASGSENVVSQSNSAVFGLENEVSGTGSFGTGLQNTISGNYSFGIGNANVISGETSFASGFKNTVSGDQSVAFGQNNIVNNERSFTFGYDNTLTGKHTFAVGRDLVAKSMGSAVFGRFNVARGTEHLWKFNEPLFVIGNGVDDANRADALTVLKNGNVGIGAEYPVSSLDVGGGIISLRGGNISNDGDDEGIYVDNDGKVGINEAAPDAALRVHYPGGLVGTTTAIAKFGPDSGLAAASNVRANGTFSVGGVSAFGSKIKAYDGIQLGMPMGGCTGSEVGTLGVSCDTIGAAQCVLYMCAPTDGQPAGSYTFQEVASFIASSGGGTGVGIEEEPIGVD